MTPPVGDKLGSYKAGDSLPVDPCDRHVEEHAPTTWEEIRLPGHPNDRISPSHQEPIAGMAPGQGVVRVRCVVEELKRALVAAVAIVEDSLPLARPRSTGFRIMKSAVQPMSPSSSLGTSSRSAMLPSGTEVGSTRTSTFPTSRS